MRIILIGAAVRAVNSPRDESPVELRYAERFADMRRAPR